MKKRLITWLLSVSMLIGLMSALALTAYATGTLSDFEGDGFTLSTAGTYPWVVVEKDGEDVLKATYGTSAHPLSTLAVTFSESGVFSCQYSTATSDTRNWLAYSFTEITSSGDYSIAENSENKTAFSGTHDWTALSVPVEAGDTLYFVYAKKTTAQNEDVWLKDLALTTGNFTVSVSANDDDYGTVSASAETVAADAADKTVTFTATAASGYRFYGWVDGSGHFLSTESPYDIEVQSNLSVVAWFGAEDQYAARVDGAFYEDVADAIDAADDGTASAPAYVVLTGNAELTGTVTLNPYTVFVLPYSDLDPTVDLSITSLRPYANSTGKATASSAVTQQGQNVTYTLTIADGASLTVPSTSVLAVGGTYSGKQPIGGQVCGPHSEIDVEGELNINGGILSCCGYIYGDGDIYVNNGTVFENFTVLNYNGGSIFLHDATVGLFPFTTYTVMGIQCQTTFDATSGLKAYCLLYAEGGNQQVPVEVVGGNKALIQMNSGYAVMKYDDTQTFTITGGGISADIGIVNIKIYGDAAVGSMQLSLGSFAVDTQDFECPLPFCITIEQVSGTLELTARLRVMPGSQLLIDEDATLSVGYGGSLNALLDNDAYEALSTNNYTYPDMNTLMASGYYPIAEVVVAGTLTVEDGAGVGGLIMVLDGGTVQVSEYADTDINLSNVAMLVNVTEEELDMTTPEFMAMMYQFNQALAGDPTAYAALMDRAADIEGGNTYVASEGGFSDSGYVEPTYTDTITFVDADYLDYVSDHDGSAEGYEPLATVTQERHTALVYPSDAPVPVKESVPYEINYNEFPFLGWTRIVTNMVGQPLAELDQNNEVLVHTTLPDVDGNTIYMAVYGDQWKYFIYTYTFEDGVDGVDITMPDPVQTNDDGYACYADIAEPTYAGYIFTGWKAGNVTWTSSPSGNTYNYKYVYDVSNLADANRTVMWTAQWEVDPNAPAADMLTLGEGGNVTVRTNNAATGPQVTIVDQTTGTMEVSYSKACTVVVYLNGSYQRLSVTDINGAHRFTMPAGFADDPNAHVYVAVKGDVNGDGNINSADAVAVSKAALRSNSQYYVALSPLNAVIGDLDGNNRVSSADAVLLQKAILRPSSSSYMALNW